MVHGLEDWQIELIYGDGDVYQRMTEAFKIKNGLDGRDLEGQWGVVKEEVEEMQEAMEEHEEIWGFYNTPGEDVVEEWVDVLYTIFLMAAMCEIDIRKAFKEKAAYNLQKSGKRREDGKVIDDVDQGT